MATAGKKSPPPSNSEVYVLSAATELRFEVDEPVKVSLQSGTAELLGSELVEGTCFTLRKGRKGAIFTFTGCKLSVESGKFANAYISSDVGINQLLLNVHSCLETKRTAAETDETRGPCVLFCGPTDVGKSTAVKVLASYAARCGRKPIVLDLDVGQNDLILPGNIAAQCISRPLNWELEWDQEEEPLVFPFGYTSPSHNLPLYKHIVEKLVQNVEVRMENEALCLHSGIIINTCGWIQDAGVDLIKQAANLCEVDYIFVIDSERLANDLKTFVPENVKVIRIPKSPGVVQRSSSVRQAARDYAVSAYFHGRMVQLSPHRVSLPIASYSFYRLSAARNNARLDTIVPRAVSSGTEKKEDEKDLAVEVWRLPVRVTVTEANVKSLYYRICAVSQASTPDEIVDHPVFGFVCIEEVKPGAFVSVIAPASELPPSGILLVTDVQYLDSSR